jgi:phosphoglycerol transferase MdoB-like AlkP superfamily enzyme
MYKFYGRIKQNKKQPVFNSSNHLIQYSKQFIYYLLIFTLGFIGFRGGIQYRPINIMTASQHGSPKLTALILNTPFSIIKTMGKEELPSLKYFSDSDAKEICPTIHEGKSSFSVGVASGLKPPNVVIIILESFGKEYIGSLNNSKGYTPFLDSLMKESLIFTDAYANAKRSMEGIPAVVASIPALMNEPFVTSAYNGNQITGLSKLLKKKNYASAFYHGGTNGTMNFDNFSRIAGYDRYIGRREYNNDNDFDGSWGIYDEPFMQFAAEDMNKTQQPFFTTIFSVSSHHPYSVPKKYKNSFAKGTLPIHQSVMYADYSLKKFFEAASKMPWFNNTLFVITADHTAISEYPKYQTKVGIYSVPIVFYMPGSSLKGQSNITIQQIDILPSVLDVVGYDEKYFGFGNDVFDSTASHFAVNFLNDNYQIISGGYALSMDTSHAISFYHYSVDSLLQNNLLNVDTVLQNSLERKLKAFIQNYNHALLENKMTIDH